MWPIFVEFRSATSEIRRRKKRRKKEEERKKEIRVKYKFAEYYVGRPKNTSID